VKTSDTDVFQGLISFSKAMTTALNGKEKGFGIARVSGLGGAILLSPTGNVEENSAGLFGFTRNATEQTFTVGGSSYAPIPNGYEVNWWAVSGITG
jgi:hypothetical protein